MFDEMEERDIVWKNSMVFGVWKTEEFLLDNIYVMDGRQESDFLE